MATLIGLFILGRDAEVRRTSSGDPVATLSLAYNYGRKGNDGKRPTQWVEGALWGDRAESLQEYLTKGSQFLMHVEDVHIETFDKRDGGQGVKLAGRVSAIEFTRGARQEGQGQQPTQRQAPPARQQAARTPAAQPRASTGFEDMEDGDIPFTDPLKSRAFALVA